MLIQTLPRPEVLETLRAFSAFENIMFNGKFTVTKPAVRSQALRGGELPPTMAWVMALPQVVQKVKVQRWLVLHPAGSGKIAGACHGPEPSLFLVEHACAMLA